MNIFIPFFLYTIVLSLSIFSFDYNFLSFFPFLLYNEIAKKYKTEKKVEYTMTIQIQFNEEEIKAAIEEWVKEQEHRENQKNEFRVKEREQVLLDLLPIIEKEGSVHDDDMLYQKEKYPFSSEEFIFLVETIEEYAKQFQLTFEEEDLELETEDEEDFYFPNSCCALRFNGKTLIFRTMHGQGTVSSVWEHDPKTEKTPPFVISYEKMIKHEYLVDNKLFAFFEKRFTSKM